MVGLPPLAELNLFTFKIIKDYLGTQLCLKAKLSLAFSYQAMNIPVFLPSSPINNGGKSDTGFLSYDRTYKPASRQKNKQRLLLEMYRDKSVPVIFPDSLFKFKKYKMSMKYRNKKVTPGTSWLCSHKVYCLFCDDCKQT